MTIDDIFKEGSLRVRGLFSVSCCYQITDEPEFFSHCCHGLREALAFRRRIREREAANPFVQVMFISITPVMG